MDDRGDEMVAEAHGRGEVVSELSLLDGGPDSSEAKAIGPTRLLALGREGLVELVTRHPHAALVLLAVVGRRLRDVEAAARSRLARNANAEEE